MYFFKNYEQVEKGPINLKLNINELHFLQVCADYFPPPEDRRNGIVNNAVRFGGHLNARRVCVVIVLDCVR